MKDKHEDDTLAAKIEALVLLWVLSLFSTLFPLILSVVVKNTGTKDGSKREAKALALIRALNFVAGGIFLATILLHLIPDVHDQLTEALLAYGVETPYPLPEFTVAVGLLFFLLFEQFVLWVKYKSDEPDDEKPAEETALKDKEYRSYDTMEKEAADPAPVTSSTEEPEVAKDDGSVDAMHDPLDQCQHTCEKTGWQSGSLVTIIPKDSGECVQTSSVLRSYCLLIALSSHAIFEGMVVGFQKNTAATWEICFAILVHKTLVAFSLGSRLVQIKDKISNKHYAGLIFIFTTTTPIGGVIGTLLSFPKNSISIDLAEAILVGLATGSFLFVTFFEILRFDCGARTNLQMCLCMLFGFGLIAFEMFLHKHHHAEAT